MALTIKDASGTNVVVQTSADEACFIAGGTIAAASVAASCSDLICLVGSATKIVRVKKVVFGGAGVSTAANQLVLLKKHTVANSGGTKATAPAITRKDSGTGSTATAVVDVYTANPTIDSGATTMDARHLCIQPATAAVSPLIWDFTINGEMPLVLRGIAQEMAINLSGTLVTITSAVFTWSIEWEESAA